jgi:hypothetical protein
MGESGRTDPEPVEEVDAPEGEILAEVRDEFDEEPVCPPVITDLPITAPTTGPFSPHPGPMAMGGAPPTYLDSEPTEPPPIRGDTR